MPGYLSISSPLSLTEAATEKPNYSNLLVRGCHEKALKSDPQMLTVSRMLPACRVQWEPRGPVGSGTGWGL